MMRFLSLCASLVFVMGCSGNVEVGDTSTNTAGGGSGGAAPTGGGGTDTTDTGGTGGMVEPSDVNGTVVYRYYGETEIVDVPVSLFGLQVQALVQEDGEWKVYPGNGTEDGTFNIPAVPAGQFMLNVAGTYVYTSAHELDLGAEIGGRPDAAYGAPGTTMAGDVTNLAPWSAFDQLEWYCPNAGGAGYGFEGAGPGVGATSLMGEASPWYGSIADGAKGDTVYLTQLSAQQGAGADYYSIVRFASFPDVQQDNGGLTSVSGAFVDVTADQSIKVDFRASEFAALANDVNPKASGYGAVFDVATLPGASEAGLFGFTNDLLLVYPGESDVDLGAVQYANPYPSWGIAAYAGETWGISYKAPGAGSGVTRYASVTAVLPLDQVDAGPIHPVVSPVLDLQVNGLDAFGPLDGISTTPTLTWKTPAIGTPTAYRVLVYELVNAGGASQAKYTAQLVSTPTTTLPIPPNVLQQGHAYVLTVTAVVSPVDVATKPFRSSVSYASADVLTSIAVP